MLQIFVVLPTGQRLRIDVQRTWLVSTLKDILGAHQKIVPTEQWLTYRGKGLDNTKTLEFYDIIDNAEIYLNVRLVGG
jgi:hypothetical protein